MAIQTRYDFLVWMVAKLHHKFLMQQTYYILYLAEYKRPPLPPHHSLHFSGIYYM